MIDNSIIKNLNLIYNSKPKNNDGKLLDDFRTSHPDFWALETSFISMMILRKLDAK